MKKIKILFICFYITNIIFAQATDIDGNVYNTITYKSITFFRDYLRTTRYNDGTVIPNVTDLDEWLSLTTGAQCDFENNPNNTLKYGKLYNYYAVETDKLCPLGWYVNSSSEVRKIVTAWDEDLTIRRANLRRTDNDFVAPSKYDSTYYFWWDFDLSQFGNTEYKLTWGTEIICVKYPEIGKIKASKTTICLNDTIELKAEILGGSKPYKFLWLPDSLSTQTIKITPQKNTEYYLLVKDKSGIVNYEKVDIWVLNYPKAEFSYNYKPNTFITEFYNNTNEIKLNDSTLLENSFLWQFEEIDPKISQPLSEISKPILYNFSGLDEYNVTLWVTNIYGCNDSITKTINTNKFSYISVPSAFSPNNDGLNDILYAVGRSLEDVSFIIYDRWGQKVFESNSLTNGWDGTFEGKELEAAVYMYYISAIATYDGKKIERKGDITIIK